MAGVTLPDPPKHGRPVLPWATGVQGLLPSLALQPGYGILMSRSAAGATIAVDAAILPAPKLPFAIYQHTPDVSNPQPEDWRTFRVHSGTITDLHPTAGGGGVSDDSDPTGAKDIVVPASSALYKIWIECDIDQNIISPPFGRPTSRTIKHDAAGWTGYPEQPESPKDGSGNYTGAPPSKLYVLVGEVTTGVDSPDTAADFHKVEIFQNLVGSVYALAVMGGRLCSGTNGIVDILRMAAWRI